MTQPTQAQIAAVAKVIADHFGGSFDEMAEAALTAAAKYGPQANLGATANTSLPAAAQVGNDKLVEGYCYGWRESYDSTIERCAQVAEDFRSDNPFPTIYGAIATAIRKLKDAP